MRKLPVLLVLTLQACRTVAAEGDLPAVLVAPNARARAELAEVISALLHGAPVTLADDALTRDSRIEIERARPRDERGRLMQGRILERPEVFVLVKNGSRCVLIHRGTGERRLLTHASCEAQAEPASSR